MRANVTQISDGGAGGGFLTQMHANDTQIMDRSYGGDGGRDGTVMRGLVVRGWG